MNYAYFLKDIYMVILARVWFKDQIKVLWYHFTYRTNMCQCGCLMFINFFQLKKYKWWDVLSQLKLLQLNI